MVEAGAAWCVLGVRCGVYREIQVTNRNTARERFNSVETLIGNSLATTARTIQGESLMSPLNTALFSEDLTQPSFPRIKAWRRGTRQCIGTPETYGHTCSEVTCVVGDTAGDSSVVHHTQHV